MSADVIDNNHYSIEGYNFCFQDGRQIVPFLSKCV